MNNTQCLVLAGLLSLPFTLAAESDPHAHHRQQMQSKPAPASLASVQLPDNLLLDQHGAEVSLKKDVIGGRIAVVSFAYTTCTTVCPVVSAIFSQVNKRLGDMMGKEVVLVTITVDPNRDTPQRLLNYSQKFAAGKGWSWLTGKQEDVIAALNAFGAYTVNFEDHPAMILIGDAVQNRWYRHYGFSSPEDIEHQVHELLQSRKK